MISVMGIGPSKEDITIKAINAIKAADVIITYKSYIKNIEELTIGKEVILKAG